MHLLDEEIVVQPGETLQTTCAYDNPRPTTVNFARARGTRYASASLEYPIDALENRNCGDHPLDDFTRL